MTRLTTPLLALLATTVFVSPALAEPEALTDQGSDQAERRTAGAYEHDGLYLRLGVGFGAFGNAVASSEKNADDEYSTGRIDGVSTVGEIMIGGAVTPQWIVGGGLWTSSVLASDFSQQDGDRVPSELREPDTFTLVGPFADWYLGSKPVWGASGSFHMQFGAAFAVLNGWRPEEARDDDARRVAIGGGLMFGAGYEWWVDPQWALGAMGRITAAALVEEDSHDDYWYHGVASFPELLFTATYN